MSQSVEQISLAELSKVLGIKVTDLIKAADRIRLEDIEDEDDVERLIAEAGILDVEDNKAREISEFLETPQAKKILKKYLPQMPSLPPEKHDDYVGFVSKELYGLLPDERKPGFSPGMIKQTIFNLGVVDVYRGSVNPEEETPPPAELFRFDKGIANSVVKNYALRKIQRVRINSIDDFEIAKKVAEKSLEEILSELGEKDIKGLESVNLYVNLNNLISYGKEIWANLRPKFGIRPRMHQIVRMYEAVKNGKKRMIIDDTTSAGKTLTSVAIKCLLDKGDDCGSSRPSRALVLAPNQALGYAWSQEEINRYAEALRLPNQDIIHVSSREDLAKIQDQDIILMGYSKLSQGSDREKNEFLDTILETIDNVDMVIIDECHNLKNINAERTKAARPIIEATKDKRVLLLSATTIPNKIQDAGFLLYMLDPVKFRYYADHPFVYEADRYSIANAFNSGKWFCFERKDAKETFNLPDLEMGIEELSIDAVHKFDIDPQFVEKYVDTWKKETDAFSAYHALRRIMLESEMDELENVCKRIREKDNDAQILIFSTLQKGFAKPLEERLQKTFEKDEIDIINSEETARSSTEATVDERLRIAREFREGKKKILINSTGTVSESISFVSGKKDVYLIFAEPQLVPANYDQTVGRPYRYGQEGRVHVVEMMPTSPDLYSKLRKAHEELSQDLNFRATWQPTTVFEDARNIRDEKIKARDLVKAALPLGHLAEVANMEQVDMSNAASLNSVRRFNTKEKSPNKRLLEGTKAVNPHVGGVYDDLLKDKRRLLLVESYDDPDWIKTSSGDANRAMNALLRTLSGSEEDYMSAKVLDWGNGTACLARIAKEDGKTGIYCLDNMKEMYEKARIKCLEQGVYTEDMIDDFLMIGDARDMPFEDESFDFVTSSHALQYNAQGFDRKRDIETILLETNRVLKKRGYGILVLPNQATSSKDLKNMKQLIKEYGFEEWMVKHIEGHGYNEETKKKNKASSYHILVFRKKENRYNLVERENNQDVFVYNKKKPMIIGGYTFTCFGESRKRSPKDRSKEVIATEFRLESGEDMLEYIKNKMKEQEE